MKAALIFILLFFSIISFSSEERKVRFDLPLWGGNNFVDFVNSSMNNTVLLSKNYHHAIILGSGHLFNDSKDNPLKKVIKIC